MQNDTVGARLREDLEALMLIPGLSGHEDRVRAWIRARLSDTGLTMRTDRMGNLIVTRPGTRPSVMLMTHMDQLGFVVSRIEDSGLLRLKRLGGVPERALPSQAVLVQVGSGRDVAGVIANKSHHATKPEEKSSVLPTGELYVDTGHSSRTEVEAAGVRIGSPVVYAPRVVPLANTRLAGTAIDDRAGCAVLIAVTEALAYEETGPELHIVFTVQEEFNLQGAVTAARALAPDIALQVDLMLASDTPDMESDGDMRLAHGPGLSLYSFHGRGTLNGVLPHPALVDHMEAVASDIGLPLQRSAQVGILTDLSYVQMLGDGVACLDVGFPMRYSHSSLEVVDLRDLDALSRLLTAAVQKIGPTFDLDRDRFGTPDI